MIFVIKQSLVVKTVEFLGIQNSTFESAHGQNIVFQIYGFFESWADTSKLTLKSFFELDFHYFI